MDRLFDTLPVAALPISMADEQSLRAYAGRLRAYVTADPGVDPVDLGRTLAAEPARAHRAVLLAEDRARVLSCLDALAEGKPADGLVTGVALTRADAAVFVFPGQGSQWPGMASELAEGCTAFRDRLGECADALAPWVDWSPRDVLDDRPDGPGLDRVDVVQPALFAVMVSLAEVWRSCGISPAAVIGHSQGEIAAACVAGALTLTDAARINAVRSRALVRLSGSGGMLSVPRSREWVERRVAEDASRVAIAVLNGPNAVVVSGDVAVLRKIVDECATDGLRARMVKVDYASHSPQVEKVREDLLADLSGVTARATATPYYSPVTGALLDTSELTAEYWYRGLRHTVRFEETVRAALGDGHRYFVEASSHPVVASVIKRTADTLPEGKEAAVHGTLRRREGGVHRLLTSLAEAYVDGLDVDWAAVLAGHGGTRPVTLPE